MPLLDQIRETKLIELAKTRFDPNLTPAELNVLRDSASSQELPEPDEKAARPVVRAAFLRWLATDPEAAPHIDPKGLRVYAATIPGEFDLDNCRVNLALYFRCCEFREKVYLRSAETRGLYILDSFLAGGISADGATLHGPLFLQRTRSEGDIRLRGARIEGIFDCLGAMLKAKGDALNADKSKIDDNVVLMDGFESEGMIRLPGAEIGGDLTVRGAKVGTVICQNAVIQGDLIWQCIERSEETALSLAGARMKNLRDDKISWPGEGNLNLDGLVYEELKIHEPSSHEDITARQYTPELPLVAKERIAWIMLQPEERRTEPQPWMQLRDLLERKGDRKGAKYVLFRFRCLQAQESWIPWRCLRIAFAWLEENPLRIGWSILFTLTFGTLVFAGAIRSGAMIETVQTQPNVIASYLESTKGTARKPDESVKPVSIHYTSFQPFIYTLENAVPLVKLGMDERWMPDLQHQPQPLCRIGWLDWLKWFNSYVFLVWFRWSLIVWGWVQATIFAAAVADRFRK